VLRVYRLAVKKVVSMAALMADRSAVMKAALMAALMAVLKVEKRVA